MRASDEVRIKYASKYARVANYYKKWIGENTGIQKTRGISEKKNLTVLYKAISAEGVNSEYAGLLTVYDSLYTNCKS